MEDESAREKGLKKGIHCFPLCLPLGTWLLLRKDLTILLCIFSYIKVRMVLSS